MDILNQISKAIKEAKWLEITYQNNTDFENENILLAIEKLYS